jgi:hypothetical protein
MPEVPPVTSVTLPENALLFIVFLYDLSQQGFYAQGRYAGAAEKSWLPTESI